MQKTITIIAIISFLLSGCTPTTPELTKSEIRATKQAEKEAQILELTRQPNFQPERPTLIAPQDEIIKNGSTGSFKVMLNDPENDHLKVTAYARPRTATDEPFKIVILPDTQIYAMYYPEIAVEQTEWIMANREKENIVAVAHLGDSVHVSADIEQWENAAEAIRVLGEDIPYGITVGNHDQLPKDEPENSTESFNQYFGVDFFEDRPYYGGHYGNNNDNSYILFSASGIDFVMLFLEFDKEPNFEVMEWAKKVLRDYPDHFGIVVVHSLLFANGSWTPQGWSVYKDLRSLSNVKLMTAGHIPGESRRTDVYRENTIHTMLSDYQTEEMGGEGKLRIWEFLPEDDVLSVTTYSPTLDKFQKSDDSQFSLELDIDHPFMEIFTMDNISSGTEIEIPFQDLESGTTYDWYVIVEDAYSLVKSPVWTFTVD
jgi:hypothetical protein